LTVPIQWQTRVWRRVHRCGLMPYLISRRSDEDAARRRRSGSAGTGARRLRAQAQPQAGSAPCITTRTLISGRDSARRSIYARPTGCLSSISSTVLPIPPFSAAAIFRRRSRTARDCWRMRGMQRLRRCATRSVRRQTAPPDPRTLARASVAEERTSAPQRESASRQKQPFAVVRNKKWP
jgi:hypothetical protein